MVLGRMLESSFGGRQMRITLPPDTRTNIVLVGMPGAGKSTIGVLLAKYTTREFVDTDVLIQVRESQSLQEILEGSDYMNLRRIEQEILLSLNIKNFVIATGGSAAYSDVAMKHLRKNGVIVFIDVEFGEAEKRVGNFDTRGIACDGEMTLHDVYIERYPLYEKYADIKMKCGKHNQDEVAEMIVSALKLKGIQK